jgi:hypothetical protein
MKKPLKRNRMDEFNSRTVEKENNFSGEISGQSWWSNRNIITGLSDTKIKQAITYHKQMVTFLENELCSRISTPRRYIVANELSFGTSSIQDRQSISRPISRKKKDLSSNLRTRINSVKRQYGTMAAEKIKKEWEIILQQYRKGA